MRRLAVGAVALIAAVGLAVGGVAWWAAAAYRAPGPASVEVTVIVERGTGAAGIAERLHAAGAIARPLVFRAAVLATGAAQQLTAGEYAFPARSSMAEVVAILTAGRTVVRRFTVPEGLSSFEVAALLGVEPALRGAIAAIPAEGRLLPETYHFAYGDERGDLLARMEGAMRSELERLWANRAAGLALRSPAEAVVLASIIEKETGVAGERARIAAVFHNRLGRGMRLQSDPTVVYALTGGQAPLGRDLTRDDLQVASPYNTYVADGLPPGPICNPGRAALEAALNPLATDELYFVADGSGGHAFARTLDEHNRNIQRWRRLRRDGVAR